MRPKSLFDPACCRATDIAKSKNKSKVVADDVFEALNELDFDKYEESLRDFLRNYNADKEDQARRATLTKKTALLVPASAD